MNRTASACIAVKRAMAFGSPVACCGVSERGTKKIKSILSKILRSLLRGVFNTPHPIHIGKIVRDARVFNVKHWQGEKMNADSLLQSVAQLFALLHERGIEYLLVGGIAMRQYVDGRNTEDIDLIIALSSLRQLPEIELTVREKYFARGLYHDLRINCLLTRHPLFAAVRERYGARRTFLEQDIPCATVEGLMLLKMYALPSLYRQGDFTRVGLYENDIAMLMHDYTPDMAALFNELEAHLMASDMASLHGIIAEIQQRIDRFREGLDEKP